jgi:hypothetical protein
MFSLKRTAPAVGHVLLPLCVVSSLTSCGQAPPAAAPLPAPSASAVAAVEPVPAPDPPDAPVPTLSTGSLAPIEDTRPVAARVVRRAADAHFETLLVELTPDPNDENTRLGDVVVSVPPIFAFATAVAAGTPKKTRTDDDARRARPFYVWARRPASAAGTPVAGDLFVAAGYGTPGKHRHFQADVPAGVSDRALVADWMEALAGQLGAGSFKAFASQRLGELAAKARPAKAPGPPGSRRMALSPAGRRTDDLATLMETTTGATAIQEALQADRTLFLTSAREPATLPLASLKAPALARHPWAEMMHLGAAVPDEPLAALAPADFYFVRVTGVSALLRLLDQVDSWGTAAAQLTSGDAEDHGLVVRYMAELGLDRGPLTSTLGPAAVSDLALVGSDPYVKEGTDVTILFHLKSAALFDSGAAAALVAQEAAHGHVTVESTTIAGVDVKIARSADGAVRQHRATVGDVAIVSNSAGALGRVLSSAQGKGPRLADEADFRYMLVRDAGTRGDALAYMGDRFVAEVVGPRQKIAEARRQVALAELMTPGFAALLYGWMNGKSPASVDDLLAGGLLARPELSHAGGGAIAWRPGEAARSPWGTAAALTPLVDLPSPDRVTPSESAGYERFARSYEYGWSRYIDPVALRVALTTAAGGETRMTVDLRELPLLDASDYTKIRDETGQARFVVSPVTGSGARVVIGIGENSEIRQAMSYLKSLSDHHELKLDWLGDWAMLGVQDQSLLAALSQDVTSPGERELIEAPTDAHRPERSDDRVLDELPSLRVYAAVGIRSPLGATLALAGLRVIANETAPGLFEWGESSAHRGVPIVRIALNRAKAREQLGKDLGGVQLFYALADGAILFALRESVLRAAIDDRLDGKGPKAPADKASGAQMVMDLAAEKGGGLWTALAWLFETGLLENRGARSRPLGEALLRGAPERASDAASMRALALAYFGAVPLAPDGTPFRLRPEGIEDAARGTAYAPIWPAVPVAGSPLDAVMSAFTRGRTEVSFDEEPSGTPARADAAPLQSLHVRVTLDGR